MRGSLLSVPNPIRYAKLISSCVLASLISLFPSLAAHSQSEPDANDPRVIELYTAAKSAEQSGDIAGAISKYKSILSLAPHLGPAYNNLGALYLREHEYPKAIAILKQGLKVDASMYSATMPRSTVAEYMAGEY